MVWTLFGAVFVWVLFGYLCGEGCFFLRFFDVLFIFNLVPLKEGTTWDQLDVHVVGRQKGLGREKLGRVAEIGQWDT